MSVMLYPCMFCVALSLRVDCLVKQFAICLGVVILLVNGMKLFIVVYGALLDMPCMVFQKVYVLWL